MKRIMYYCYFQLSWPLAEFRSFETSSKLLVHAPSNTVLITDKLVVFVSELANWACELACFQRRPNITRNGIPGARKIEYSVTIKKNIRIFCHVCHCSQKIPSCHISSPFDNFVEIALRRSTVRAFPGS